MGSVPPLLTFLLMIVSGWVHRQQLIVTEYLQAENRLLKDRLRGKRIRLSKHLCNCMMLITCCRIAVHGVRFWRG